MVLWPLLSIPNLLKWVAISFSRGSSQPKDQTHVSCICRQILYHCTTREAVEASYLTVLCLCFLICKMGPSLHLLPRAAVDVPLSWESPPRTWQKEWVLIKEGMTDKVSFDTHLLEVVTSGARLFRLNTPVCFDSSYFCFGNN